MSGSVVIGFSVKCSVPDQPGLDGKAPVLVVLSIKWPEMDHVGYHLTYLEAKSTGRPLGEDTPEMAQKIAHGIRDAFRANKLPDERRDDIRVETDGGGPGNTLGRIVIRNAEHVDVGSHGDVGKIRWEMIALMGKKQDEEGPVSGGGNGKPVPGEVFGTGCAILSTDGRTPLTAPPVVPERPRPGIEGPRKPPIPPRIGSIEAWYTPPRVRDGWKPKMPWEEFLQNRPWWHAGLVRIETDDADLVIRGVGRRGFEVPFPIIEHSAEMQSRLIAEAIVRAGVVVAFEDGLVFPLWIRTSGSRVRGCGIVIPPHTPWPWSMIVEKRSGADFSVSPEREQRIQKPRNTAEHRQRQGLVD